MRVRVKRGNGGKSKEVNIDGRKKHEGQMRGWEESEVNSKGGELKSRNMLRREKEDIEV